MRKFFARGASTLGALLLVTVLSGHTAMGQASWPLAGHDLNNTRSQPAEKNISPANVSQLVTKWVFTTGGDVSATPTTASNAVYFPDWAGNLYAVHANNGKLIWKHSIADYNHRPGSMSRVSPAISDDYLVIGDNMISAVQHDGAHIMAIDRESGNLLWITQVDAHPAAIITGSPVISGNTIYVGVSSNEEALATDPTYPCCTFRGSLVALNLATGAILWKTYTIPDNGGQTGGYSGNAIWGPVAVDRARGSVYAGVGNNYTVPAAVAQCQADAIAAGDTSKVCTAPDDYFDAAMSFNMNTGAIKWGHVLWGYDAWTVACLSSPQGANCPSPAGPDYDFGDGPNLLGNLVGFGQKSGIYWALNPSNGSIVWATPVGPGGTLGGIEWGTATDGARIYAAISNSTHQTYTLANGGPTIDWGSWAALDPSNGHIIWQIADPTPGSIDPGSVSVANGVMYAGSYSGYAYGIDAASGTILWTFNTGGSVLDGPSIANSMVFLGSGFGHIPPGIPNNKVYAFALP